MQKDRNQLVRDAHAHGELGAVIDLYWKKKGGQARGFKFQGCQNCHLPNRENQFYTALRISTSSKKRNPLTSLSLQPTRFLTRSWADATPA